MGQRASKPSLWLALLLVGLHCASIGCKEGNPLSEDATPADPDFIADEVTDGVTERFITLRKHSIFGGRIVLDVVVHEVDELVTALNIKLKYPTSFSKFTSCMDGDLFPPRDCYRQEVDPVAGEVVLGRVAIGEEEFRIVDGEKVAMRVEFLVFGVAEGRIEIVGPNLGGGDTSALEGVDETGEGRIIEVQWFSGTLAGR